MHSVIERPANSGAGYYKVAGDSSVAHFDVSTLKQFGLMLKIIKTVLMCDHTTELTGSD